MKLKYKSLLSLIILLQFTLIINCQQNSQNKELIKKIDIYMNQITSNGFSGVVLIAKDGKIIISRGYGLANRNKNIPNRSKTIFPFGSITKQFTGAAILKLQMMNKLSLYDPIKKYLPAVPYDKNSITIHHLLTHTAGFPGVIGDDFDPISRDDFIRLAMNTELHNHPGTVYEYSNVGFSLLGAIIEIVSGKTYEEFLYEYLFKPAGMKKTGYLLPEWDLHNLAHGYIVDRDWGTLIDKPWLEDGPGWHLRANGGILSTVEDMYKWHLALLGETILSEEAKKLYTFPHVKEENGASSFYGYGWTISTTIRGTRLIAHNGGNGIFAADFRRYFGDNVVIIAASNTAGNPVFKHTPVLSKIVFGYEYSLPLLSPDSLSLDQLQESPTGQCALTLLSIYADSSTQRIRQFITNHISPEVIKRIGVETLLISFKKDQRQLGETVLFSTIQTEENRLELTVKSKKSGNWWLVTIGFEDKKPFRIQQLIVEDTSPPVGTLYNTDFLKNMANETDIILK